MQKRVFSIILACLLILAMSVSGLAHSGRTDASGGHKDNKNKSGLGSYHYHCGGYPAHLHDGGYCPYTSPKRVYASSITATDVPTKINVGDTVYLKATVYPQNAEDKSISWESSNNEVLSVTSSGKLTAVGVGTAVITAKTSRGTSKKFTITSAEVIAQSIALSGNSTEILLGATANIKYQFTPENTTDKTVEWSSSDESIISISSQGKIKALQLGSATITVKHKELTDSVTITVQPIEATSVTLDYPSDIEKNKNDIPRLCVDDTMQFSALVMPENTTFKDITWSVSDESIASIDENGLLTALKTGSVTVTATTVNGIKATQEIELYSNIGTTIACVGGGIAVIAAGVAIAVKKKKKKEIVE